MEMFAHSYNTKRKKLKFRPQPSKLTKYFCFQMSILQIC